MQGKKNSQKGIYVYFLACNWFCGLYNNEEWWSKLRQLRLRKFFEYFLT